MNSSLEDIRRDQPWTRVRQHQKSKNVFNKSALVAARPVNRLVVACEQALAGF